ncbi:hypothetical protein C1H46_020067 [Malus baccata]|uniref:Uncharacterized protein n=1 Tax=Malus baccata TaxID=106549 RepID=A0A540M676_MALBA|nr:hypothetical protein C1H46_020067 [Malus baccata]
MHSWQTRNEVVVLPDRHNCLYACNLRQCDHVCHKFDTLEQVAQFHSCRDK